VALSASLLGLLTQDSSGVNVVLKVPFSLSTIENALSFAIYHSIDPLREIEKPLRSSDMSDLVQPWYADFLSRLTQEQIFDVILLSNMILFETLKTLACATVASMIKGKTPEQIRTLFNIVNDFTPEEEAQVIEENKWCEEY
jgi:S-phase kinase-associated protein 1